MRREEFEHLLRAAGEVLATKDLFVFGSQAILAHPGALPDAATRSLETDLASRADPSEENADLLDGVLGEFSSFHESFGVYADGVTLDTITVPTGWQARLVPYVNENTNGVTGWCLEAHDLCLAKLVANRPKDHEFVRALVLHGLVDPERLAVLVGDVPVGGEVRRRLSEVIGSWRSADES